MEEEIIAYQSKMYDKIEKFDTRPLYILQVNKNNCRVLVSCNDIPHWTTFYENIGESQAVYLNNYIPKSGSQIVTIQIYPKEGQEYIADNADVDIKLKFAKDIDDGVDVYKNLAHVELPEDIGSKKAPYFELKIPFTANVPWDFGKDLETAQDLSKVPNIEEKIVAKYNQLRDLLVNGDGLSFLKEIEYSDLKSCSYLYATKEELLVEDKRENMDVEQANLNYTNRIIEEIENYEVVFGYNNKLILLRSKKNKESRIRVEYDAPNGKGRDGVSKPITLYIPSGSNELKVW
ncbi:hypothetical protein FNW52_06990 [Flavobacterium sp. ZT3R18]|uniref:hypothetical protein n=1 Tax=Flavobacterium sp. ZT3R18 TaxID=2594429 RepID=UPI00117B0C40|nr:hypothetical protein [Flavobacterium sp. ZT3R18]TRX36979.1 hypothetical protein FNW52_06990 [Flavobacterium sp. ZT3R18]